MRRSISAAAAALVAQLLLIRAGAGFSTQRQVLLGLVTRYQQHRVTATPAVHRRRRWSPSGSIGSRAYSRINPSYSTPPPKKDEDSADDNENDAPPSDRTTFDQAGRSLMDEQDSKRMEEMGDFDANPNSSVDQMDKMREAIRARTASMGLEKSKVSADYIAQRQQQAVSMGSKAASESNDVFGGLDLSQISTSKAAPSSSARNSLWADEEEMPSMFYDPDDELSEEERAEVDPMGQKGILEQGLNELQNTKWPAPGAALKEVGLMIVIVAFSAALIIGWDKFLRSIYTDVLHFIPSKDDLANYVNRFDGLDLPSGWTDNMNEADIATFSDKVVGGSATTTNLPEM